jgi:hypothetical protein
MQSNLQILCENLHVFASSRHVEYRLSESCCRLPSVSLSSSDKTGKTTPVLSMEDYAESVDRVEALNACPVFPVAGRPVAGDSDARVKGAWLWRQPRWTATQTQQYHSKSQSGVEVAGTQTWFLSTVKTYENLTHPQLGVLGRYIWKLNKYPEMQYCSCGRQAKRKDFLQYRHTYDV